MTRAPILLLLVLSGCGASTVLEDRDAGSAGGADAGVTPPDACPGVAEDDGSECAPVDPILPPNESLWPEPTDGPTACPRGEGLVRTHDRIGASVLHVRGALWGKNHSRNAGISFQLTDEFCGYDTVADVQYHIAGAGAYSVVDERPVCEADDGEMIWSEECLGAFRAVAFHDRWQGTGRLVLEEDDRRIARGSVDVLFPDGCRLLADFVAPQCWTE